MQSCIQTGICRQQTRSCPLNIPSFSAGMIRRALVEKQVISTAAGEQKATWFQGRKREEGDVVAERMSECPMLWGWRVCLCCRAEIEQTCLLGADADYKTLVWVFKKRYEDCVFLVSDMPLKLSAQKAKFNSQTPAVALTKSVSPCFFQNKSPTMRPQSTGSTNVKDSKGLTYRCSLAAFCCWFNDNIWWIKSFSKLEPLLLSDMCFASL